MLPSVVGFCVLSWFSSRLSNQSMFTQQDALPLLFLPLLERPRNLSLAIFCLFFTHCPRMTSSNPMPFRISYILTKLIFYTLLPNLLLPSRPTSPTASLLFLLRYLMSITHTVHSEWNLFSLVPASQKKLSFSMTSSK